MIKVTMTFSRSTKNTHVYVDDSDTAAIPTLYIKRSALSAKPPASITVTIDDKNY